MITGMGAISKGVKENLAEMKKLKLAKHPSPAKDVSGKLELVLQKMQKKVDSELADPARKDDPLVAIDVKMLSTMKAAVKKSEALIMVGAIAMKKAKSQEERQKIKLSVKGAMQKVMGQLKTDINDLKQQAVVVGTEELRKKKEAEAKDEPSPDAEP